LRAKRGFKGIVGRDGQQDFLSTDARLYPVPGQWLDHGSVKKYIWQREQH
jgi:hypothetical protein